MRIRRVFTTRRGGVSAPPWDSFNLGNGVGDDPAAVAANRARLAAETGLPAGRIVWMDQVHGTTVTRVTSAQGALATATDGLVTVTQILGLAVLVADCVPLLAADPVAGVIAAVHAGRRGAASGVAIAALRQMERAGADIARVEVLVGPAVCGECYEVPAAMRDEVEATLPGSACRTAIGSPGLDLRAGLVRQLRTVGIAGLRVDPRCTMSDPELYSHRRGAPTGRFAGLIWMQP